NGKALSALDSIEASLYRKKELEAYLQGLKTAELNIAEDFEKVLIDFTEKHPNLSIVSEIIYRMGKNYYEEGNYSKAIEKLRKFFDMGGYDTSNVEKLSTAQYYLAESYYVLGKYEESVTAYNILINNFAKFKQIEKAYLRVGSAYLNLKKYEKSITAYSELVKKYPKSEYLRLSKYNLGVAYKSLGKTDEACLAFIDYYKLDITDDSSLQIMLEVGEMYMKQRDYTKAIAAFQEVLADLEAVQKIGIQYKIAECYEKQFKAQEAIVEYRKLLDMEPKTDMTRLSGLVKLAEILEEKKFYNEAYDVYQEVLVDVTDKQWQDVIKLRIEDIESMKTTQSEEKTQ
ncbi:tetratricopeptide repeat protein, partial [bacterium]